MLDDDTTANQDGTLLLSSSDIGDGASGHRASLIVLAGWEIGRQIDLQGDEHLFGRSPLAHTCISLPSISRQHARIVRVTEEGRDAFVLTDLNSSNGTRVNNEPTTTVRLNNGDKIRMGDVLFKFLLQDKLDARFHQDIHRLIHYDQLTGLLTMDAFRRELDGAMQRAERLSLSMTDLDGLKRVNDTYGHLAGRMVVREMGVMMRATLPPHGHAGLYGGDEAIICYAGASIAEAEVHAERLRETIAARAFHHEGHTFGVTISQGLAEWPRQGQTIEQLIAAADGALYAAKTAGRNCIRFAENNTATEPGEVQRPDGEMKPENPEDS